MFDLIVIIYYHNAFIQYKSLLFLKKKIIKYHLVINGIRFKQKDLYFFSLMKNEFVAN